MIIKYSVYTVFYRQHKVGSLGSCVIINKENNAVCTD